MVELPAFLVDVLLERGSCRRVHLGAREAEARPDEEARSDRPVFGEGERGTLVRGDDAHRRGGAVHEELVRARSERACDAVERQDGRQRLAVLELAQERNAETAIPADVAERHPGMRARGADSITDSTSHLIRLRFDMIEAIGLVLRHSLSMI